MNAPLKRRNVSDSPFLIAALDELKIRMHSLSDAQSFDILCSELFFSSFLSILEYSDIDLKESLDDFESIVRFLLLDIKSAEKPQPSFLSQTVLLDIASIDEVLAEESFIDYLLNDLKSIDAYKLPDLNNIEVIPIFIKTVIAYYVLCYSEAHDRNDSIVTSVNVVNTLLDDHIYKTIFLPNISCLKYCNELTLKTFLLVISLLVRSENQRVGFLFGAYYNNSHEQLLSHVRNLFTRALMLEFGIMDSKNNQFYSMLSHHKDDVPIKSAISGYVVIDHPFINNTYERSNPSSHGNFLQDLEDMRRDFPKYQDVINILSKAYISSESRKTPINFTPIILKGEKGIGKSTFAKRLVKTFGKEGLLADDTSDLKFIESKLAKRSRIACLNLTIIIDNVNIYAKTDRDILKRLASLITHYKEVNWILIANNFKSKYEDLILPARVINIHAESAHNLEDNDKSLLLDVLHEYNLMNGCNLNSRNEIIEMIAQRLRNDTPKIGRD
ncbi:hypothetical protein ACI2KR_27405 [Pseudomonas luteola]